jgi:hypothetical protein
MDLSYVSLAITIDIIWTIVAAWWIVNSEAFGGKERLSLLHIIIYLLVITLQ